ncbi:hypothetical protein RHSIM_Rhsim09G0026300 [Rhododendron simsii]|uniref:F-box domain-containing protein n=1 Tax=Rhododendron simsii TaxID=118357 RepID=A0A834GH83_RHOSS|nr:hypothetical protein RHSIM_Rhsim09G0026300 [Rhododendron simsii]
MELRRKKRIKRAEAEKRLPYIPEGIIVHILAKLPVKSLLRFRYVSKNWHSLISDPKFNLSTQRQQVIVMSMPMRQSKYQKSASVHLIDDEASVKELPMPEPLRGALANEVAGDEEAGGEEECPSTNMLEQQFDLDGGATNERLERRRSAEKYEAGDMVYWGGDRGVNCGSGGLQTLAKDLSFRQQSQVLQLF